MGRLSDKIKIVYLILVILFAMGVFVYLLDTWDLIRLEDISTVFKREPPKVKDSDDNPTLIELERMKKELDRLKELEARLKEKEALLKAREAELNKLSEKNSEVKKGLKEEEQRQAEVRAAELQRKLLIERMAARLGAMPPGDAVAIVEGWSNSDLVAVFRQMEKTADEEGRQSIVPYLITQLPRDRARIITSIMMDSDATKLPKSDG